MQKKLLKTISATLLFSGSLLANAETVQFFTPACVSEDELSEFTRYMINNDKSGVTQLVEAGLCTGLSEGDTVSVIDRGFTYVKIRYKGVVLYTATEAVK